MCDCAGAPTSRLMRTWRWRARSWGPSRSFSLASSPMSRYAWLNHLAKLNQPDTDWYKWIRTFFFIAFRSFDRIRLHSLACAKISAVSLTPLIQALSINNKLSGVVVTAEADTMVSFCQRGCAPPVSPPAVCASEFLESKSHVKCGFQGRCEQLETERNVLRQRWNTECGEKMGIKTKLKVGSSSSDHSSDHSIFLDLELGWVSMSNL